MGFQALFSNTIGSGNTAYGLSTLFLNTSGNYNTALGINAGYLTTGDNNIDIGNVGAAGESNTIRIGGDTGYGSQTATFIAGISGTAVAGTGVVVDGNGQLGVLVSSERFKNEIKPMDRASEAILSLKPVTFRYKHNVDPKAILQFGLVAEEVEKINPDLVTRDSDGKPLTVRYDAVNAMLLNEFLKEHKKVAELEGTIAQLKATVAQQEKDFAAQLKRLDSKIQAVDDKVELNKPAPRTVENR